MIDLKSRLHGFNIHTVRNPIACLHGVKIDTLTIIHWGVENGLLASQVNYSAEQCQCCEGLFGCLLMMKSPPRQV